MGPWRVQSPATRALRRRTGRGGASLSVLLSRWRLPPLHRSLLQGSAPVGRVDVCDRLRERPDVPARVLGAVLPLAVRPIRRLAADLRAGRLGLRSMSVGVLDPHEQVRRPRFALNHDHRAVLVDELRPVIADLEPFAEPERAAEPLGRLAHVAVRQLGDDRDVWNGPVRLQAPAAAVERTSAASRSAIRSSADSMPTESRIRLRGAANGESAVEACVIWAGCSIRLSTPPSDSASVQTLVRATSSTASSSERARIEIIPPKSDIWRLAISCPGWLASPG